MLYRENLGRLIGTLLLAMSLAGCSGSKESETRVNLIAEIHQTMIQEISPRDKLAVISARHNWENN